MQEDDDRYREVLASPSEYIQRLIRFSKGEDLPDHLVQQTTFLLYKGERLLGKINLRHRLNEALEIEGGHIGYDIRPSERRKGYATWMLRATLNKARALGLDKVMLTCDADNAASAKVIEKNGGRLSGRAISPRSGRDVLHYWIEL